MPHMHWVARQNKLELYAPTYWDRRPGPETGTGDYFVKFRILSAAASFYCSVSCDRDKNFSIFEIAPIRSVKMGWFAKRPIRFF